CGSACRRHAGKERSQAGGCAGSLPAQTGQGRHGIGASRAEMIAPGAWLGLLGGGQLGRMFSMAAQSMGYRVMVIDPGDHSPAGDVADACVRADYLDPAALARLARECAAVTTEFENVPAEALRRLARDCFVSPAADSVAVAQDRIREKEFLARVVSVGD